VLIFHPAVSAGAGKFDIGGSECGGIKVEQPELKCKWTMPPQTGLAASFTNYPGVHASTVNVHLEATAVKITNMEGPSYCPKEATTGTWTGSWQVSAYNKAGSFDNLYVEPLTGLYMEGEEFKAEQYPMTVAGAQEGTPVMKFGGTGAHKVRCTSTTLGGVLSSASTSLGPLEAQYEGCKASFVFKTIINMHSCHYVLHAAGSMDITCTKEGDVIEVAIYNEAETAVMCTATIPAQNGLKGVKFSNTGKLGGRGITAALEVTGIKFTTKGTEANCQTPIGAHTDGTYTGSFALHGAQ
jgi:hypothetical protein